MPLEVDGQRSIRPVQNHPRRRAALLGVEPIAALERHDGRVEVLGQARAVVLVDPRPAHAAGPSFPERAVAHGTSPSHVLGRWKR